MEGIEMSENENTGWGVSTREMMSSDAVTGWGHPEDASKVGNDWVTSSQQGPIDRWGTHEEAVQWEPEEEGQFMDEGAVAEEYPEHHITFAQQMPSGEYAKQTAAYTKQAVADLLSSRDYQRFYTRCKLCWCIWSEGQFTESCAECGGFAMMRPCPICRGKCGSMWSRDVDLSHSENEANWDGECRLPEEERMGYMQQYFMGGMEATEEDVLDGMHQLQTG